MKRQSAWPAAPEHTGTSGLRCTRCFVSPSSAAPIAAAQGRRNVHQTGALLQASSSDARLSPGRFGPTSMHDFHAAQRSQSDAESSAILGTKPPGRRRQALAPPSTLPLPRVQSTPLTAREAPSNRRQRELTASTDARWAAASRRAPSAGPKGAPAGPASCPLNFALGAAASCRVLHGFQK